MRKLATLLAATAVLVLVATSATAENPIRISQVFGAGGPANAYGADYVELYNRSGTPVSLDGWSLQCGGSGIDGFPLASACQFGPGAVVPANGYFLVQCGSATPGLLPVTPDAYAPAVDLDGSIGKVVVINAAPHAMICLVNSFNPPEGVTVEDGVGYGLSGGVCWEGSLPAPNAGAFLVLTRRFGGMLDTDDNFFDVTATAVTAGEPIMHNASSGYQNPHGTPGIGACCLNDQTVCTELKQLDCMFVGRYLGDGTTCTPGICTTSTGRQTWGTLKTMYR